ncbi:MAG TPA: alpha-amylase domain-containing protein [Nitrospiraceae bacterium]|nr:alpha-amylase domain-containing protein [Nitrospiraceae bacterium]
MMRRGMSLVSEVRRALALACLGVLTIAALQPSALQAGTIIQLYHRPGDTHWDWTWKEVQKQLKDIKAAGYTAILLSPHQAACGGEFSVGYDPYDFTKFTSAHGSEAELASLIQKAHQQGLQVYADMIMNHMCSNNFTYPRFGKNDFHHHGGITNWDDPWQLENGTLFGLEDLAQEVPYVRGELFNYLVKTNNMGFDGYRWDAAKHVPRWFWKDHVINNVNQWGKFSFGEVYDGNVAILQQYADTGMAVTDYSLYFLMRDTFKFGGNLSVLDGAGLAGANGPKAVTFVENHDVGPPPNRLLAYAFIASYPGYPLFFNVPLDDTVFNNLLWVQNNLARGAYINRYKDQNTIIFERDHSLLAGINQYGDWVSKWVPTTWTNTKLHDYTGHVKDAWTNKDGYVEIWIPPLSYVMLAPG